MANNRVSNKKLSLYYKCTRSLSVFVVSMILLVIFLLPLVNVSLNECSEFSTRGGNSCVTEQVVTFVYFSPVVFIMLIIALISGMIMISARSALGKDFTKAKKIAKKNSKKVKKKKEYTDDLI